MFIFITLLILLSSPCFFGAYYHIVLPDNYDKSYENQPNTQNGNTPVCNEKYLIDFLAKLQVLNPESIIYLSTVEHINDLCTKIHKLSSDTKAYTKNCELSNDLKLYTQLINGVENFYKKICVDNPFRAEFMEKWPCLNKVRGFELCHGPADWQEDNDTQKICQYYQSITNCYYEKAKSHCDKAAAIVMVHLTDEIMKSTLFCNCTVTIPGKGGTTTQKTVPPIDKKQYMNGSNVHRLRIVWCFILCTIVILK